MDPLCSVCASLLLDIQNYLEPKPCDSRSWQPKKLLSVMVDLGLDQHRFFSDMNLFFIRPHHQTVDSLKLSWKTLCPICYRLWDHGLSAEGRSLLRKADERLSITSMAAYQCYNRCGIVIFLSQGVYPDSRQLFEESRSHGPPISGGIFLEALNFYSREMLLEKRLNYA